jgi:hypothetical protein
MQIRIVGKPKNISLKECRAACHFFANLLMKQRLHQQIKLILKFVDSLQETRLGKMFALSSDEWAAIDYLDDGSEPHREFEVVLIDNMHSQKTLEVIAHEMTHLKQYAKGELDYSNWVDLKKWHGKLVDFGKLSRWDYPWEIEAIGRETGLVSRFLELHAKKFNFPIKKV